MLNISRSNVFGQLCTSHSAYHFTEHSACSKSFGQADAKTIRAEKIIKFFIVLVYTTIQQRSKTVKTNKICPVNISNMTFMIRNYVNGNVISQNEFVLKFVLPNVNYKS